MIRNKTVEELFNGAATLDKKERVVSIDLNKLDPAGKINTGEGFILALVKALAENQGTEAGRVLEVSKANPFLSLRNGVNVFATAISLKFFSSVPINEVDIDEV